MTARSPEPSPVALIMAAGKGTRMRSALPKVIHRIAGSPLIRHVVATLEGMGVSRAIAIVGHGAEAVRAELPGWVESVEQREQLGTAHAVLQAAQALEGHPGDVFILSGDVPLLSRETLARMLSEHRSAGAALSILSFHPADPARYGRVLRDAAGGVSGVVEYKDATDAQREIGEVNAGIYVAHWPRLLAALQRVGNANAQHEYYLPDVVGILLGDGERVLAIATDDPTEVAGVNTRLELVELASEYRRRTATRWLEAGVTLEDAATTWIGPEVEIGEDTVIEGGVQLYGRTLIARGCRIGAYSQIVSSQLGEGVVLWQSMIFDSQIGARTTVGPFAHLRNHADVGEGCRVGNFVEIKGSVLGNGAKASHLAYLGDATLGQKVNVGAGTITCNYDGVRKHKTIIGDRTFIGTNNTLVAPVTIGSDAYTAAGSTITHDVPDGALALGRARQAIKPGWVLKRKGITP